MLMVTRVMIVCATALALATAPALAGPKMVIDKQEVDVGVYIEGKVKTVEAVFKITNTGDAVLHIKKVKPG
jgi:hypothetical protein